MQMWMRLCLLCNGRRVHLCEVSICNRKYTLVFHNFLYHFFTLISFSSYARCLLLLLSLSREQFLSLLALRGVQHAAVDVIVFAVQWAACALVRAAVVASVFAEPKDSTL